MKYFVYHFEVFLLIMIRLNAMIVVAPFFSSGVVPMRTKGMISFLITLVIFPVVAAKGYALPGSMGEYGMLVLREVTIGLFIGFLVSVIFAAFQLAGDFFAVQIGFGINEVLDPLAQISVPLVGQLKNLIGLLVFMAIYGHHFMIEAVYRSYELAPIISFNQAFAAGIFKYLLYAFNGMFIIALKIALPVIGTVLMLTIAEGLLAKAAPQMNIMMLGFPLKIIVAFGVLIITSPLIIRIMQVSLERTFKIMTNILLNWPK